jgi:D-glycero-alpha-D-manno-heptose-7-phosphate kinase
VVSILGAFIEWLQLDLSEYEIARLAFSIEREDLNMAGGKQDQYAAVFGGINFLEFGANNLVQVHPLSISKALVNELEVNLLLFYTKTSRESSKIIEIQSQNVQNKQAKPIQAMHLLKEQAFAMKQALVDGDLKAIGQILNTSWHHKKMMADGISNSIIDTIYNTAMEAGAVGGKISGAGGGGFMIFYVNDANRNAVVNQLNTFNGEVKHFEFCFAGLTTWTIHE